MNEFTDYINLWEKKIMIDRLIQIICILKI